MARYKVNAGNREEDVCSHEEARGMHREYVFVRQEKNGRSIPIKKMYGTAWQNARERAADAWEKSHGNAAPEGFRRVRVHDLKHTSGRRLRAAGVSFEDRQDLLGHKSQRITTHYSEAELANLIKMMGNVAEHEPVTLRPNPVGTRSDGSGMIVA
jgi:integrase